MAAGRVIKTLLLGAGGVASSLAPALESTGLVAIRQVYSWHLENATLLARKLKNAQPIADTKEVSTDIDLVLVSVADDAIAKMVDEINLPHAIWLHTSGSIPMQALAKSTPRHGVFYPLQTFSRGNDVDLSAVTLFSEASTEEVAQLINDIATPIFRRVCPADSEMRRLMHVAAVFACNFSNFMWVTAHDLLNAHGLPFDVLAPLLQETLRKAITNSPASGQTGPARRGDFGVMEAHAKMLPPAQSQLYEIISKSIVEYFSKND